MNRSVLASIYLMMLSGLVMKSSAENWVLVWSDEFNNPGLPDDMKWSYDVGGDGWGNNELQYYTEKRIENARIEDTALIIDTRKESYSGKNYTSARLVSRKKGDWLYGKIEVRAKLPSGKGTWPAIWMLPTDREYGNWPASGEIDIMEHVGYDPGVIHATVHTDELNHTKGTQVGESKKVDDCSNEYHVYSLEWFADHLDVFVDGIKYFTFDNRNKGYKTWPFDKKFHIILNTAFGGDWGGAQGIDNTLISAKFYIDYVRVFQMAENSPVSLIVNSSPGGKVIIDPVKSEYASGDRIIITAESDSGFQFQSWTGDFTSNVNPFTFNIIHSTVLNANFCSIGEMVVNGGFDDNLSSWAEWSNTGTAAKREVDDGKFKITITEAGSNDWDLQLSQSGMNMIAGNKYRISFKAWAQSSRTITVRVNMTVPPHNAWYSKIISIDATPRTYNYEFSMADQEDDNARIEFDFGKSDITTFIDDVSLRNITPTNIHENRFVSSTVIKSISKKAEKQLYIDNYKCNYGCNLLGRNVRGHLINQNKPHVANGIFIMTDVE